MAKFSGLAEALTGMPETQTDWVANPLQLFSSAADEQKRRKAEKAKHAGSSIAGSGAGAGGSLNSQPEGLRDQIIDAMNVSGRL